MKRLSAPISPKGWTMIELMLTISIMGLLVPTLTQLFTICYQGLSEVEMHLQLKQTNAMMALHFHEQVNSSKHMYQNTAGATAIINSLSIVASGAPAPATFSGSPSTYQLATAQSGATVSFDPAYAVASEFGNALFYADTDRSMYVKGVSYTAPLTISGSSVTNSGGYPCTVNLDIYRFYFDYLSSAGDMKPISGVTSYWLIEWQSVQFADAFEIQDLANADSNNVLEKSVVNYLVSQGMTLAYDPTQAGLTMVDGSGAVTGWSFYTLAAGSVPQSVTSLTVPMANWYPLSRMNSGAIASFNYSIPGNYAALGTSPSAPKIPAYCTASSVPNAFPGGFEVGIKGSSGGMQVLTRCVLVAQGNNKSGLVWDDTTSVNNARDIW